MVIPGSAPPGIDGKQFRRPTGIVAGDLGIVFANGRAVPVVVAEVGPAYKTGEGSTALLSALSGDGQASTVGGGVRYMLFAVTALGRDVPADELGRLISDRVNVYAAGY